MTYDELYALIAQRGVHPEFGAAGEGWGIEQNPHELATFLVRMQELGVESVLEIGTGYKGGLSRFLAQDMGWSVTSIDIKDYGHLFEGVHYIHLNNITDEFKLDKHDLVFIDGNHAYETAKADYELWGEFAAKVIAFHDIAGLRDCEGVKQFWEAISNPVEVGIHKMPGMPLYRSTYFGSNPAGIGWIEL